MSSNDLVLLDQVLAEREASRTSPVADDVAFELFACEQALSGSGVTLDDVATGVVGGGNDGGLDAVFTFVEGILLEEDSELLDPDSSVMTASGPRIDLWLVQAKRSASFSETAVDKVSSSVGRLLDLTESEESLLDLYSKPLVARISMFRTVVTRLGIRHPRISIHFVYATRGNTSGINEKVRTKAEDLKDQFDSLLPEAKGYVEFLGAAELWSRATSLPSYTLQLTYQENATLGNCHVALVSLKDYYDFLTDDSGLLRRHIFDSNVRDYQGAVEVNREIAASLIDPEAPEFWWLNNGVTVICTQSSIVARTYSLDDVQIVNGLQTSKAIFDALRDADESAPAWDRSVLVRILNTEDPDTRDAVIRATNRQTSVPAASLRATDPVQRAIEAFFLHSAWYYDRRKGYYHNLGKSPEQIVSISLLAQAIMALGLGRPDDSRARPSSLLKRDDDYATIFNSEIPLSVYLWAAMAQKEVDSFLLSPEADAIPPERTNLRFHLSTLAVAKLIGTRVYSPTQLEPLAGAGTSISDADLPACLSELRRHYSDAMAESGDTQDKVAKSRAFVRRIVALPLS